MPTFWWAALEKGLQSTRLLSGPEVDVSGREKSAAAFGVFSQAAAASGGDLPGPEERLSWGLLQQRAVSCQPDALVPYEKGTWTLLICLKHLRNVEGSQKDLERLAWLKLPLHFNQG